jgi:ribosome-associated protein
MNLSNKINHIIASLEDGKARDIETIDVSEKSSFTSTMIIATGTSTTHVRSVGSRVAQDLKEAGEPPIGVEITPEPDWVLVDANDIVVHVFTKTARDRYALSDLWSINSKSEDI